MSLHVGKDTQAYALKASSKQRAPNMSFSLSIPINIPLRYIKTRSIFFQECLVIKTTGSNVGLFLLK